MSQPLNYANLSSNFPNYDVHPSDVNLPNSIWKFIGGKVLLNAQNGTFTNSCCIRLSAALNGSGCNLPGPSGGYEVSSGADGKWNIFRVADMKNFLAQTFGTAADYATPAQFRAAAKKGIVVLDIAFPDATGHASLWDGNKLIDTEDWSAPQKWCHLI